MYFSRDDLPVASVLFDVLGKTLFSTYMTETYYPLFLSYIMYIVKEKTDFLFQSKSSLAFDIVDGLVNLLTKKQPLLRQKVIGTLYMFAKKDYERNNKSTKTTQIHMISSLFNWYLQLKAKGISITEDKSINESIELLDEWRKKETSTEGNMIDENQDMLPNERKEKKLEKWNQNVLKKRLSLIESIEKEKDSKGKRRCVL